MVSEDHSDLIVYLESMVYKGAYNEMIVWAKDENEEYQSLLVHSMNDEQIATDIGIKFRFDDIAVAPCEERKGAASLKTTQTAGDQNKQTIASRKERSCLLYTSRCV